MKNVVKTKTKTFSVLNRLPNKTFLDSRRETGALQIPC